MLKKILKKEHLLVLLILDEEFENKYIRTPIGGFYNHSNEPNVMRMVSDILPKLIFGDPIDLNKAMTKIKDGKKEGENSFYHLQEKSDAKFMFLLSIRDIKAGDEITKLQSLHLSKNWGRFTNDLK